MAVIQVSDLKIGDTVMLFGKVEPLSIKGEVMGVKTNTVSKSLALSSVFILGLGWLDLANFEEIEVI
jgi:hypothetical protein